MTRHCCYTVCICNAAREVTSEILSRLLYDFFFYGDTFRPPSHSGRLHHLGGCTRNLACRIHMTHDLHPYKARTQYSDFRGTRRLRGEDCPIFPPRYPFCTLFRVQPWIRYNSTLSTFIIAQPSCQSVFKRFPRAVRRWYPLWSKSRHKPYPPANPRHARTLGAEGALGKLCGGRPRIGT